MKDSKVIKELQKVMVSVNKIMDILDKIANEQNDIILRQTCIAKAMKEILGFDVDEMVKLYNEKVKEEAKVETS